MSEISERPGLSLMATMPEGVKIVGLIDYRGMLVLATSEGVYYYDVSQAAFMPIEIIHG